MALDRSTYVGPAVALAIPPCYLGLVALGVDRVDAAVCTPLLGTLVAVALWRYARRPLDWRAPGRLSAGRLVLRAAALMLLILLTEEVLAAVVARLAPVAPLDDPQSRAVALREDLGIMLGVPIGMLVIFGLGVWSVRLLPVMYPFRWLTVVTVASRSLRLLLYPSAAAYSQTRELHLYGLWHTLADTATLGGLIFCLLALGNYRGRAARPATGPAASRPGAGSADGDAGPDPAGPRPGGADARADAARSGPAGE
ncbi:hypothetical protein AB0J86_19185 [Micromonospora sp. NPDC049559]|uniref:hypothetical protein n=1 Tax=Micromonospora sp. NPDC049559 TaxID=3155923 RepID=UPI003449C0DF